MKKEVAQAFEREFALWPTVAMRIEIRSSHPKVVVSFAGAKRSVPICGTPSDFRSTRNNITQLRRVLRDLGAEMVR